MSLVFSIIAFMKKECFSIFINWRYSIFFYQSKQQMFLNAICFFFAV